MPSSIPGIENLPTAVKWLIAVAIIFALLALFALVLRRLTGGRLALTADRGRARQPRLGIVDVYDLPDRQRQLILLRRDNVEHLLMVGGPNDIVVETNIVRGPPRVVSQTEVAERPETPPETAARPAIEAPTPLRVARNEAAPARAETAIADAARPVAPARAEAAPARPGIFQSFRNREPAREARPGPREVPAREAAAPAAPREVAQQRPAPEEERGRREVGADMVRQLGESLRRPAQPAPVQREPRPEPRPEPSRPEAPQRAEPARVETQRAEPQRAEPARQVAPAPDTQRPRPQRPAPVAPPRMPVERPEPRSNGRIGEPMQEAPRAPVPSREMPPRPAPIQPPAFVPEPQRQEPRPDLQRPEPPQAPRQELQRVEPQRFKPEPAPEPSGPSMPDFIVGSPPAAPVPIEAASAPEPQPRHPEPTPPRQADSSRPDPFSIEDIEAEFARLLGRPLDRRDKT